MQRAAGAGDRQTVAIADASFHARLVLAGNNATLSRVWRALKPFARTYITLVVPSSDVQWTADLHTPILEALRQRDAEMVVRALREPFAAVSARLCEERSESVTRLVERNRAAVEPALRAG